MQEQSLLPRTGHYYFPAHDNYHAGYISDVCQLNSVNIQLTGSNLAPPYTADQISKCGESSHDILQFNQRRQLHRLYQSSVPGGEALSSQQKACDRSAHISKGVLSSQISVRCAPAITLLTIVANYLIIR